MHGVLLRQLEQMVEYQDEEITIGLARSMRGRVFRFRQISGVGRGRGDVGASIEGDY